MSLKVAFVTTYAPIGDSLSHERHVQARERLVLRTLAERTGWHVRGFGVVHVGSPADGYTDGSVSWDYLPLDAPSGKGVPHPHAGDSSALVSAITRWAPDVVLVKGIGTPLSRRLFRSGSFRRGVVVGGRFRAIESVRTDFVLTEKDEQDAYFGRFLPRDRIVRFNKLVDEEFFRAGSLRLSRDDRVESRYDVIVVGGLEPWKNHEALLPLAAAGLRILIAGQGSCRPRLEQAFGPYSEAVTFSGQLSREQLIQSLTESSVLCHPSLSEGFPRAIAEAMACGLPVVALSSVVGKPVEHGRNGFLVTQEGLLSAVQSLLRDPDLYDSLSMGARRTAEQQFGQERVLETAAELVGLCDAPPVRSVRSARLRVGTGMQWCAEQFAMLRALAAPRRRLRRLVGS